MSVIERVSIRWCLRCACRALHVFAPSRGGGRWLCDRCKGRELPESAAVVEQEAVAA